MGGIKVDVYGRTGLEGFYACGEAACNGIHGANRLASNSLLEGLVFGHKIGKHIAEKLEDPSMRKVEFAASYKTDRVEKDIDVDSMIAELKKIMTEYVGIIRNKDGLLKARNRMDEFYETVRDMKNETMKAMELQNMILLSRLVIDSALKREESRGAHYRSDFSKPDENWLKHIIQVRDGAEE